MNDRTFWDGPGDRAEVVAGRYRVADPVTGEVRSWTRASNIGAAVADQWALERYTNRQLVRGLAARTDLLDLLKASVELDNAKVDEVIETALQVSGSTIKANQGTTIHEVQRRVDLGLPVPEGMEHYTDGYRAALKRAGLTVVAVEVLVCNRPLGAMGRADRVYREADSTLVIGDTKSTAHLDLAQHEIAPQMATYACADYLDSRGFVGEWRRFDAGAAPDKPAWVPTTEHPIRTDYAIAVHVDRESGAVSLYRVDLHLGGYAANLATQVREYRNVKGILLPYVQPHVPAAAGNQARTLERHLSAVPDPFEQAAPDHPQDVHDRVQTATGLPTDQVSTALANMVRPVLDQAYTHAQMLTEMAEAAGFLQPDERTEQASNEAAAAYPTTGNEGSTALPPTVDNVAPVGDRVGPPLRSAADLLRQKVTKAEVQQYAREHGLTNLAHNKKVLVEMLAAAGWLAEPGTVSAAGQAPRTKDPGELTGPVGGADPTNPRSDGFRRARLAEIAAASTVAEVRRINESVTKRGGDQAWTDEMTTAARARVTALDARNGQPSELENLAGCVTSQQVADLWDRVTVGGSAPDRWTITLDGAARARLEEIKLATPPAPANPFANS